MEKITKGIKETYGFLLNLPSKGNLGSASLMPFKIKNPPQLDNGPNLWFRTLPDMDAGN